MDETISLVLFSGTDDKLQAAAVLDARVPPRSGGRSDLPAVLGLDAFRADRITADHGLAPEAGRQAGPPSMRRRRPGRPLGGDAAAAKELGDVDIQACSASMDILKLDQSDLDPLVDGVEGVAAFYINAGEGQIIFI